MGRLSLTIMAGAAEVERNLVRERTSAAMDRKAARREDTGGSRLRLDPRGGQSSVGGGLCGADSDRGGPHPPASGASPAEDRSGA